LPEQVQIVQYTVLDDKILIWLISKTDFQGVAVQFSNEDLREKIGSYLKLITTADETRAMKGVKLAVDLYQILISPFRDKIDADKTIALIPDKSLSQLPFGSLISPETDNISLPKEPSFLLRAQIFCLPLQKTPEN
jgi:CHAT domain-containing protein